MGRGDATGAKVLAAGGLNHSRPANPPWRTRMG